MSSFLRPRPATFLLLALVLVLGACQADEERLAEHMERGDQYMEEEQWAEAIIEYKNVLQIDPNNADAHWGLAQAYFNNEQVRDGFWELRETVRLDPENLEARLRFAQMSIFAGEFEEALSQTDAVIAADPERVEALLVRAQALDQLERPEEVLQTLEEAIETAPENDAALLLLANFQRQAGDREAAEALFRKRVELDPNVRTLSALAGFLSEDDERAAEAEEVWGRALEAASGEERDNVRARIAGFYYRQDRFDDAVATLEEGIEESENKLELIYLLARFHAAQGNNDKADDLIHRATEAAPDEARPHLILSAYRGRKGDLEGALESARNAVRVEPDNVAAQLRVSEVLVEIGYREDDGEKIAEGRAIAEGVLAEEPSHPGALFVRAKIEMAEGEIAAAIGTLRQAIDARPDWAQAHFVLGTALAVQGDRAAARTELARALEIDASLTEAHQVLAQVHAALGEHEYAVEEGRLYLRERPDAIPTRILVAQSLLRLRQPEEALAELRTIPEEERTPEVHYALGKILTSQGKTEEARPELMAALESHADHADVLRSLLDLDRRDGRFEESRKRILAAIEANPDKASLHRLKGRMLLMAGEGEEAEAALKRAIELDSTDVQSYQLLASYYRAAGRVDETIETFETAAEVGDDVAYIHHFLGVLYETKGEPRKAIEHYEEAVRQDPNLAESKNNLAYLFAESGQNLDRALDLAQEAKALLPENANAADTLGWVLFKRGVPSAAITYLKEAEAGMDPGSPGLGVVRVHLAQAYKENGQKEEARAALQRALADYEARREQLVGEQASAPPDPEWARSARSMLETL